MPERNYDPEMGENRRDEDYVGPEDFGYDEISEAMPFEEDPLDMMDEDEPFDFDIMVFERCYRNATSGFDDRRLFGGIEKDLKG